MQFPHHVIGQARHDLRQVAGAESLGVRLDHGLLFGHLITSDGWTITVSRTHRDRAA
jgi:hypothetical protein